jgi:pimeloyl-ACP methyl ester carboxylesterase
MGGMQALQWGVSNPDRMRSIVALVPMARTRPWTVAMNEVARRMDALRTVKAPALLLVSGLDLYNPVDDAIETATLIPSATWCIWMVMPVTRLRPTLRGNSTTTGARSANS